MTVMVEDGQSLKMRVLTTALLGVGVAAANAVERAETGISEEAIAQLVAGARERLNDPLSVDTPQVRERMRARFADHAR